MPAFCCYRAIFALFGMNGILIQGMVSCYEHFRDEFDNKMGRFIPVWAIRPSTI